MDPRRKAVRALSGNDFLLGSLEIFAREHIMHEALKLCKTESVADVKSAATQMVKQAADTSGTGNNLRTETAYPHLQLAILRYRNIAADLLQRRSKKRTNKAKTLLSSEPFLFSRVQDDLDAHLHDLATLPPDGMAGFALDVDNWLRSFVDEWNSAAANKQHEWNEHPEEALLFDEHAPGPAEGGRIDIRMLPSTTRDLCFLLVDLCAQNPTWALHAGMLNVVYYLVVFGNRWCNAACPFLARLSSLCTCVQPLWRVWDHASAFCIAGQQPPSGTSRKIQTPAPSALPFDLTLVLDNGVFDMNHLLKHGIDAEAAVRIRASEYTFAISRSDPTRGIHVQFDQSNRLSIRRSFDIPDENVDMRVNSGTADFFVSQRKTRRVSWAYCLKFGNLLRELRQITKSKTVATQPGSRLPVTRQTAVVHLLPAVFDTMHASPNILGLVKRIRSPRDLFVASLRERPTSEWEWALFDPIFVPSSTLFAPLTVDVYRPWEGDDCRDLDIPSVQPVATSTWTTLEFPIVQAWNLMKTGFVRRVSECEGLENERLVMGNWLCSWDISEAPAGCFTFAILDKEAWAKNRVLAHSVDTLCSCEGTSHDALQAMLHLACRQHAVADTARHFIPLGVLWSACNNQREAEAFVSFMLPSIAVCVDRVRTNVGAKTAEMLETRCQKVGLDFSSQLSTQDAWEWLDALAQDGSDLVASRMLAMEAGNALMSKEDASDGVAELEHGKWLGKAPTTCRSPLATNRMWTHLASSSGPSGVSARSCIPKYECCTDDPFPTLPFGNRLVPSS